MRTTPPRRPLEVLLVDSVLDGAPGEPRTGGAPAHPEALAAASTVPGHLVREAAHLHRVTPAVYRHVSHLPHAPRDWVGALRGEARAQVIRHLLAMADLAAARDVLRRVGCRWVAVKGPVVAETVWPAPSMREYYDVDLVVERSAFADALPALLDAGFTQVDRNWPLLLSSRRAEIELRGPQGTAVDLHWDIAVPPRLRSAFRTDVSGMLARATESTVSGVRGVPILDAVDTAVHLAFHAAQGGANRLMWIADVRFAVGQEAFDWDEFVRRVRAMRFDVPAALVLGRVERTLGFAEPVPPAATLARRGRLWAVLAADRDRRVAFPGLPGDPHLGGSIYVSARQSTWASLREAAHFAREIRRESRQSPTVPPPLHEDVPDPAARRRYLAAVTRGDAP